MRITPHLACWTTGVVLLLGGCASHKVAGSALPRPNAIGAEPAVVEPVPAYGAPKVENPVDVGDAEQRPCELLTDAQLTELLGSDISEKRDDVTGPTCHWHSYGPQSANIMLGFPKVTDVGLTAIYRTASDGGQYKFLRPMAPVRGLPVVAWGTEDGTATRGLCNVAVGTTDRSTLEATVRLSARHVGSKDPCEAARSILETSLANIEHGI